LTNVNQIYLQISKVSVILLVRLCGLLFGLLVVSITTACIRRFIGVYILLKLLAYGIIGFKINQYSVLLVYMVTGALIGSFVGTLLRRSISNRWFSQILKILLTIMTLRMIYSAFQ